MRVLLSTSPQMLLKKSEPLCLKAAVTSATTRNWLRKKIRKNETVNITSRQPLLSRPAELMKMFRRVIWFEVHFPQPRFSNTGAETLDYLSKTQTVPEGSITPC